MLDPPSEKKSKVGRQSLLGFNGVGWEGRDCSQNGGCRQGKKAGRPRVYLSLIGARVERTVVGAEEGLPPRPRRSAGRRGDAAPLGREE